MSRLLLLLAACTPQTPDWDLQPRALDHTPPPGSQQMVLTGPTSLYAQTPQRWTVTDTDLAVGDRVEIGWGGDLGPGRCPYARLVGGHLCLDIMQPARPLAQTTAVAHPTIPGAAIALFDIAVPGTTRDHIHLQAIKVAGADSATSNTLDVQLLRGQRCDPAGQPFGGGAGTESDPYLVCAPDHVGALSGLTHTHALQVQDLDWAGRSINNLELGVGSVYDGGNHRILHFTAGDPLFGYVRDLATLRRLSVVDGFVVAQSSAALLVGSARPDSTLEDLSVSGWVHGVHSSSQGGGVVTYALRSTLRNLTADVEVSAESSVGGIVGTMEGGFATGLISHGSVSALSSSAAGGLAGTVKSASSLPAVLEDSYSDADVNGANSGIGGAVGHIPSGSVPSVIRGTIAAGSVYGGRYIGGFIGRMESGLIQQSASWGDVLGRDRYIGGFAGELSNNSPIVEDVYSTSRVVSVTRPSDCSVGGMVGWMTSGTVRRIVSTPHSVTILGSPGYDLVGGTCAGSSGSFQDAYAIEADPSAELVSFTDVSGAPESRDSYPSLNFVDTWSIPSANPQSTLRTPVPQRLCDRQGIACVPDGSLILPPAPAGCTPDPVTVLGSGETCRSILDGDPSAATGTWMVDPDGSGNPFAAWCDMDTRGGGWMMFAAHADGETVAEAAPIRTGPGCYGVLGDAAWIAARDSMVDGMMFIDEHGNISEISAAKLYAGRCQSIDETTSLVPTSPFTTHLWHDEVSGCTGSGLDYSVVVLGGPTANAEASVYQYATPFDLWPYGSNTSYLAQAELRYFLR